MSTPEAVSLFRQHFDREWAKRTPVAWPNVDFEPPEDGTAWVRFSVRAGGADQADMGAERVRDRYDGVIYVQIMTPKGTGDGDGLELAQAAATILHGIRASGVLIRVPTVRPVGPDGAWYQTNVEAPYQVDVIRTVPA